MALALAMESAFILGGSAGAASSDGLAWANLSAGNALHAWDFLTDQARFNSVAVGPLANTPGWSFARASTGYAATSAGVLTAFSSGALRRTDKGVLIEGARTNLCLQSQTFDNATWNLVDATVVADAIAAPDGTTTADKLVEGSSAGSQHRASQGISVTTTPYAYSVYAKAGTRTWVAVGNNSDTQRVYFDLANGVLGTQTSATGIITALANGWYRCTAIFTPSSAATKTCQVNLASADNTISYNGDGASYAYIWGAQLEAASFPSSYIPTTTASATRAAEPNSVSPIGADYPLSGVVRFMRAVDTGGVETLVQIDDGSANNRVRVAVDASDRAELLVDSGGVTQAQIAVTGALALNTVHTIAWRVGSNTAHICVNGTLGTEDTSVTVPATPTAIRFGAGVSSALPSFGYGQRAALWTRLLANGELQSLAVA